MHIIKFFNNIKKEKIKCLHLPIAYQMVQEKIDIKIQIEIQSYQ
jgi:hypothetical protein